MKPQRIVSPQGVVQGEGGDRQRTVKQDSFFVGSVCPVIGNKNPGQVRQIADESVFFDKGVIVKVEIVRQGVQIKDKSQQEHTSDPGQVLLAEERQPQRELAGRLPSCSLCHQTINW